MLVTVMFVDLWGMVCVCVVWLVAKGGGTGESCFERERVREGGGERVREGGGERVGEKERGRGGESDRGRGTGKGGREGGRGGG